MNFLDAVLLLLAGTLFGIILVRLLTWILTKRAERRAAAARAREEGEFVREEDEFARGPRFPSYLEGDAQGMHAGQKSADEDSNDDERSQLLDAVAASYRETLRGLYPNPPEPPSYASPRERSEWRAACDDLYYYIDRELLEFMNSHTSANVEELDRLLAEIQAKRKK